MARDEQKSLSIFDKILQSLPPALLTVLILSVASALHAQSYSVIANFTAYNGQSPGSVTTDAAGNIYGTTFYGGRNGYLGPGTAFKLSRHDSVWRLTTLYSFTGQADGSNPNSPLTIGPDGSLYGTTNYGGTFGHGVLYKLQPPASTCKVALCYWTETVLYNFSGGSNDGGGPQGNLMFDRVGNIYGTTFGGGSANYGTVYELSPSGGQWTINLLHSFTDGADGGYPADGVIFDQAGNLYGVAETGGGTNNGVVYELSNNGSGWTLNVLHTFSGSGFQDGSQPSGVAFDSHGNLFGFTAEGGIGDTGTIYELQAGNGGYTYSRLYDFQSQTGVGPGLTTVPIFDGAGNMYGTAEGGGTDGLGVLFEFSPSGGGWSYTVVHNFTGDPDGSEPAGGMAFDAQGNLYGPTEEDGTGSFGTIWQYTP